jgi:hypothetical protein
VEGKNGKIVKTQENKMKITIILPKIEIKFLKKNAIPSE